MPPPTSHQVAGTVYDANGNTLAGATVLLTHTNGRLAVTSNAAGEYMHNLKNLSSWAVGDSITLKGSKTNFGQKTETVIVSSGPADDQDITLAYTSDLIIDTGDDRIKTNAALLVDFEGNKITPANPLPVTNTDFDIVSNPESEWTITRSDGQPDSETVTINQVAYQRTFTYNDNGLLIKRSKWVEQ